MNENIIDYRLSSYQNDNIIKEAKIQRQNQKLFLRKKKIIDTINSRRKFIMLNAFSSPSKSAKTAGIKLAQLNIPQDYKSQDYISHILLSQSTREIFKFINEVYNFTNTYNESLLLFGLYLLNQKLSNKYENKSESDININIDEIIQNGFFDICLKILEYSKKEIETKDANDDFLYEIYQIMLNFSYYAEVKDNIKFTSKEFLSYHNFFLQKCSNDLIISNIIYLLSNICSDSFYYGNIILCYDNIFTEIILYAESAIENNKQLLINSISFLFYSYISSLHSSYKENTISNIDYKILYSIYSIIINIFNFSLCVDNCIWAIARLYKITLKNSMAEFFNLIVDSREMLISLFAVDYSSYGDYLYPFCKIIKYIYIGLNNLNLAEGEIIKDKLNKISDFLLNEAMIIDFFCPLLKEKYTPTIETQMLSALNEIGKNFNYAKTIAQTSLIGAIVKCLNSPYYKTKKKCLMLIETLSKKSFQTSSILIKKGLLCKLLEIINPDYRMCTDADMILLSLKIIWNIFEIGEWLIEINGRNCFVDKFENLGGKSAIEKLLGNPNKEVYLQSEKIQLRFFKDDI